MTAQNPPLYLQTEAHPAEDFRRFISSLATLREGVVNSTDTSILVTERSGTANMSVDVAEGAVVIAGTEATYQGHYFAENRGVTNVVISPADVTNDRYDLIVARVQDSIFSGASDTFTIEVVTGAPAGTPLFPTVPDNAFVLATVLVPNGASSIVDADITDIRSASDSDGTTTLINRGFFAAPGGVVVCTSVTRPSSPPTGMKIYETDTGEGRRWDGSSWDFVDRDGDGQRVTFTPTLNGLTMTNESAEYIRVGDLVHLQYVGEVSAAGSGDLSLDLPVTGDLRSMIVGEWTGVDDSAGPDWFSARAFMNGDGLAVSARRVDNAGTNASGWGQTVPITWASGDLIHINLTYFAD